MTPGRGSVALAHPATGLGVSPDGRFIFVLHRTADRLSIVDAATNRIVHTAPTGPQPDHVVHSRYPPVIVAAVPLLVDLAQVRPDLV